MGIFHVDAEVSGIRGGKPVVVHRLVVDSGSEFSWLPEPVLKRAGVHVAKKDQVFIMANGQTVTRAIGYAILRTRDFETVDQVVFGQEGDLSLLGARTLEGFGALVDSRHKRLVAAGPHLAAPG